MEVADAWASLLPDDLFLDIIRRLGGTAVMRCAGVCKRWRRAIMGNASTLHPRLDVFVPILLLGFVPDYITGWNDLKWLHRTPPAPPSQPESILGNGSGAIVTRRYSDTILGRVLSSRDGFVLINEFAGNLCLWNLVVTGACRFLPVPRLGDYKAYAYALITSYDDQQTTASTSSHPEVQILAVKVNRCSRCRNNFHYQTFTATSGNHGGAGAWGPVQRSQDFDARINLSMGESTEVVCRGCVVHWLSSNATCTVALDVYTVALDIRTGRTWMTLLPQSGSPTRDDGVVLATSGDGERLSVIRWLKEQQEIQVWELTGGGGGDQWIQRRAMDVRKLVAGTGDNIWVLMDIFCPRSGCLSVDVNAQMFLLDVDKGSSTRIHNSCLGCRPYHMDWSSYWSMCVSKMKYF